ncbi:MAG: hypothetical protein CVV27_13670, partial [Candidatus Melainabacteria bacterium HGW-Melainabacteria-1]
MDVKSGFLNVQPAWHRFWDQATQLTNTVADSVSELVDDVKAHAEGFWQDSTDFVVGRSPVVVALLDPEADPPKITVGTKVLIIGDSQTVGPYGKTIDELARATGATVSTHASWGASPHWFFNGTESYKYWSRDTEGDSETRMRASTPSLNA